MIFRMSFTYVLRRGDVFLEIPFMSECERKE